MTKQEMIDKIYEKIADKSLTFGCKIQYKDLYWKDKLDVILLDDDIIHYINTYWEIKHWHWCDYDFNNWKYKIIGHPVMLWDVLDYLEKEKQLHPTWLFFKELSLEIMKVWKDKRKSIDEQSEETITYIYNLIK